jgi:serine/threonine protein kinase
MRKCDGDLHHFIPEITTEAQACAIAIACLDDVQCLYDNHGYLYYDVKPANFLYSCTGNGQMEALLSDYGGCNVPGHEVCGTYPAGWLLQSDKQPVRGLRYAKNAVSNTLYDWAPLILMLLQVEIMSLDTGNTRADASLYLVHNSTKSKAEQTYSRIDEDLCFPVLSKECKDVIMYCSRFNGAIGGFTESGPGDRKIELTFAKLREKLGLWKAAHAQKEVVVPSVPPTATPRLLPICA